MKPITGMDPAVRFAAQALKEQKRAFIPVAKRAGVSVNLMTFWTRHGRSPSVNNLRAVLNVLGYDLAVIPLEPQKPVDVSGMTTDNDKHA